MKATGLGNLGKAMVFRFGLMEPDTKGNGEITKQTAKGNLFMQMGIFMMETGMMIKLQVLALTIIIMGPSTQDNGQMTNSMDMGLKLGLTDPNTKGFTIWVKRMAKGNTSGKMGVFMMGVGSIIK